SLGFSNINADLIAGLDGDSLLSFKESLEWLLSLSPENITVHALTQKRASQIRECGSWSGVDASAMVDYAGGRLTQAGYAPYYMYKQKATVDNLENTGFTKPGFEGLYNIFTMDERHTIIAAGAGAVSKLKNQITGDIERIYNYKYPAEYIDGFSTILKRKEEIRNFYENIVPKKETV
ncbi:MAG: coproporphyrinogen dehydrogenase HemZ, partial [Oscillospiraceae bacterium]